VWPAANGGKGFRGEAPQLDRAEWVIVHRNLDVDVEAVDLLDLTLNWAAGQWPLRYADFDPVLPEADLVDQGHVSESLHPNVYGQEAIGTCIKHWYEDTQVTGRSNKKVDCRNGASNSSTDMYLTELPATRYRVNTTDAAIPDTGNPSGPNGWLDSYVRVPAHPDGEGGEPGRVMALYLDIDRARKGHLGVMLFGPGERYFELRNPNLNDTGGWQEGWWFFEGEVYRQGTWQLRIVDYTSGYSGTLKEWGLKFY
jgi:hypothetical protein